jgi:DNA repair exonuclease SbcCD ATPase subunit
VTKEKFIRAIVGEPQFIVQHGENIELEEQLAEVKASLKAKKNDVAGIVAELERQGRELSRKHEAIKLQTSQLKDLPEKIDYLQNSIAELKAAQAPGPSVNFSLPLDKTMALVEDKEKESAELDRTLEKLQAELPRKMRGLERLEAELQPLEVKRLGTTALAREAKRRKEDALGGSGDNMEERGRWWRGVESGLKVLLDVEVK